MTKCFLSYRREDTADITGRIYDRLVNHYGDANVFQDVDSIPPGVDFRKQLSEAVGRCQVLLAVIGRQWLTVTNFAGKRRLDDPRDFVRIEIEAALQRDIPVIPVLVQGVEMPAERDLPPPLQPLAYRNAITVSRDPHFHRDLDRLIKYLDQWFAQVRSQASGPAAVGSLEPRLTRSKTTWPPLTKGSLARRRKQAKAVPARVRRLIVKEPRLDEDLVDCSVFAPSTVWETQVVFVQVFVHMPDQTELARGLATEFDPDAQRRGFRSLESTVARGTQLTFDLTMPGLNMGESVQTLIWKGRPESVQFAVGVPDEHGAGTVIGTVTVSQDTIPMGHIKFKLVIDRSAANDVVKRSQPVGDDARHYSKAFVSYASADREKVLLRVQMLKALAIEFFQDILNLDPGDRWEKELYRHIDECDLFLLFWSKAAKESRWVRKEVQYALARKGDDEYAPPEIKPVIIEGPPVVSPWGEISHLHFNDALVYLMVKA
jgi:hypothetical protein